MATTDVYSPTTESEPKPNQWFVVPTETLDKLRCLVKVAEVLLSFVAFILEEVVSSCLSCGTLYFFEFVSCTAFLFTLLLLVLLSTTLHRRVGISCWPTLDFAYTALIAALFLLASIAFAADNSQSGLEQSAVAFGFLSTMAFALDAGLFVKNNGLPFTKGNKTEVGNGNGTAQPAEHESLNPAASGTA